MNTLAEVGKDIAIAFYLAVPLAFAASSQQFPQWNREVRNATVQTIGYAAMRNHDGQYLVTREGHTDLSAHRPRLIDQDGDCLPDEWTRGAYVSRVGMGYADTTRPATASERMLGHAVLQEAFPEYCR